MMVNEIAHFCLILVLVVSAIQAISTLITYWSVGDISAAGRGQGNNQNNLQFAIKAICAPATLIQFILVAFAFLTLMRAFVLSDFSVKIVAENSHSAKPMLYKVAGVWGNHEGSMLLWIVMLTFLGAMVAYFARNLPGAFRARVLGVQSGIVAIFLSFLLFTSNPFARLDVIPLDGRDLNPLLQDPGLAFHPPFLYFGYVGFSVAFAFAIAALWEGRVGPGWARWVRPWTLLAWSSLTLGIAMGSWWAYYELGWGGFWFWDPVENASLMPWLAGTALIHSAIVLEKRDTLKVWTVLMAILTFSTSLMGTFLVRSGLLTSVHAFANDPLRGQFLLLIFLAITGAALLLFALRARKMVPGGRFALISRESALIGNNLILSIILLTVFLGTFWPSFAEFFFNRQLSVGPPYFNTVTIPFAFLLVLLMTAGTFTSWKRAKSSTILTRLKWTLLASILGTLLTWWILHGGPLLSYLGAFMGIWVICGVFIDIAGRIGLFKTGFMVSVKRIFGLPISFWGSSFAHLGIGVILLGITGTTMWVERNIDVMQPGDEMEIAGYQLRLDGFEAGQVNNYETFIGRFSLLRGGKVVAELAPEKRNYPVAGQVTTEAAITPRWASDVYVALGDVRDAGVVVSAWYHPLVYFLWVGSIIMAFGGLLSLSDRRFRAGVPQRFVSKRPSDPVTKPIAKPAVT